MWLIISKELKKKKNLQQKMIMRQINNNYIIEKENTIKRCYIF